MRILGVILLVCCYTALNHYIRLFVQAHKEVKEEIAEQERTEKDSKSITDHHIFVDNHKN